MAKKNICDAVESASRVTLVRPIKVYGVNTYVLTSNFISWGESNSCRLSDIAPTFGALREQAAGGMSSECGDRFVCGDNTIEMFDFGLLYNVFCAMTMAQVELGAAFPLESGTAAGFEINYAWFGNNLVVYSAARDIIIPIRNTEIEAVCDNKKVKVQNFTSVAEYNISRVGMSICVDSLDSKQLCNLPISDCTQKSYPNCFGYIPEVMRENPATVWDERSDLGKLITGSAARGSIEEVLGEYRKTSFIEAVATRRDLMCAPTETFPERKDFFGSVCFTDKNEIALAVNFRNGLFVYYPWFNDEYVSEPDLKIDATATFPKFYNIMEYCTRITRFAQTVVNRPLTPAQLDLSVFNQIKTAFFDMKLKRLPLYSSFGRVVIPESVLARELASGFGESLFCMVPVGTIGSKIITITSEGHLIAVEPSGWTLDSAFFDITEVLK